MRIRDWSSDVCSSDLPIVYDEAEIGRAGAVVSIGSDGRLCVDRGYVRLEDEAPIAVDSHGDAETGTEAPDGSEPSAPTVQRAVITIGGQTEPEEDEDDVVKPLPDRLVTALTAHRTLALRDAVANNSPVAMTMPLHKLCPDTFPPPSSTGCLAGSVRHVHRKSGGA